jgi:hypothetical protein
VTRPCALCSVLHALCLIFSAPVLAKQEGASVCTLAIPADGQSTATAVDVARIADDAWAADQDVSLLDLERVLEGGDPLWVEKLQKAQEAREKGKQALDAVELPVAADAFAEAIVQYEQAIAGMKDITPIVETLAQQGTVLSLQGDAKNARAVFSRALALDPAFRLPNDAAKRVSKLFDEVVKESRNVGQGTLTVYATTGAAEVWVDGVFRGVAPLSISARTGRHYVRTARDGYVAQGTAVEVKRGSEATVQAQLRPTSKLAKLEELGLRVARSKDSVRPIAELAAWLQVDQLLTVVVEDSGGSALLTAVLVDAVSGKQIARASKAFAPKDEFFERDVRGFVKAKLMASTGEAPPDATTPSDIKTPEQPSLLPGEAEQIETPGAVIGGWVLIGLSAIPIGTTIGFGIGSYNLYDGYRNKLPSQLDPNFEKLRGAWLTTSIVTDVSWILAVGMLAGGTTLLVTGYSEKAAMEEVVNP